jgi:hypothetical protein
MPPVPSADMSRMTRRPEWTGTTLAAALGAGAMVAGALGPWATSHNALGQSSTVGMDHGGVAIVLLAVCIAFLAVAGQPTLIAFCALGAGGWTALVIYYLPGTLIDSGASQADMTWGAYLALAGAVVAIVAALIRSRKPPGPSTAI